jgi:hypothetical protein
MSALSLDTGRELAVVYVWLESVLEPDTVLNGLHPSGNMPADADGIAPGVVYPAVTWNHQADAGPGVAYAGGGRAWSYAGLYQVKAITEGERGVSKAQAIDARVHALIQGASNVAVSAPSIGVTGEILWCLKRSTVSYPEVDESGRRFRHHGGLYEIAARSS